MAERATGLGVRLPTLRSALPAKSCSDGQYGRSFLAPDGLRVTTHLWYQSDQGQCSARRNVFALDYHERQYPMQKFIVTVAALAAILATTGAFAQGAPPQAGTMPMQGMTPAQPGGMAMGCCPMMQRAAATVDSRLRQLEERAGVPSPPAQPSMPGHAH